jgi:hypothetical protein
VRGPAGWHDDPVPDPSSIALRDAVRRIVDELDPEGLLAVGAPADEYGPEVAALAELVAAGPVDAAGVRAVWEHWFGPDSSVARNPDRLNRLTAALAALRG